MSLPFTSRVVRLSPQRPGRAVLLRHQPSGFRISDDLLLVRIPANLMSGAIGDIGQLAGRRRTVPFYHCAVRRPARIQTFDEVALMRAPACFKSRRAVNRLGLFLFGDDLVTSTIEQHRASRAEKLN